MKALIVTHLFDHDESLKLAWPPGERAGTTFDEASRRIIRQTYPMYPDKKKTEVLVSGGKRRRNGAQRGK